MPGVKWKVLCECIRWRPCEANNCINRPLAPMYTFTRICTYTPIHATHTWKPGKIKTSKRSKRSSIQSNDKVLRGVAVKMLYVCYSGGICKVFIVRAREGARAALLEDRVQFPAPTWWFTPVLIPASEVQCPLLVSLGNKHTCSVQTHISKIPTQIKYIKIVFKLAW